MGPPCDARSCPGHERFSTCTALLHTTRNSKPSLQSGPLNYVVVVVIVVVVVCADTRGHDTKPQICLISELLWQWEYVLSIVNKVLLNWDLRFKDLRI